MKRPLVHVSRGELYDTSDGAQLAIHVWVWRYGAHIFRRPFEVVFERSDS